MVAFSSFNSLTSFDVSSKKDLIDESKPNPILPISPSYLFFLTSNTLYRDLF